MKYLKGTLIAFIITAAFCTCSVSAAQYSMANVSIPNLKGIATTEKVANKKYHQYSLGMKQKLGIAQVLMEDPKIMVFDEAFNGLDEDSVKKIRKILLEEKKKGKIIILATHIKEDIHMLCDVIYKFNDGVVTKVNKQK